MPESNKYYVPTLEEFHIGFEYEQYEDYDTLPEKKWNKQTFLSDCFNPESVYFVSQSCIYTENIRVKYLDKEDIESLGFKLYTRYSNDLYTNGKYVIHTLENSQIEIIDGSEIYYDSHYLYSGTCKNKSKLKQLLKDIGVL